MAERPSPMTSGMKDPSSWGTAMAGMLVPSRMKGTATRGIRPQKILPPARMSRRGPLVAGDSFKIERIATLFLRTESKAHSERLLAEAHQPGGICKKNSATPEQTGTFAAPISRHDEASFSRPPGPPFCHPLTRRCPPPCPGSETGAGANSDPGGCRLDDAAGIHHVRPLPAQRGSA